MRSRLVTLFWHEEYRTPTFITISPRLFIVFANITNMSQNRHYEMPNLTGKCTNIQFQLRLCDSPQLTVYRLTALCQTDGMIEAAETEEKGRRHNPVRGTSLLAPN